MRFIAIAALFFYSGLYGYAQLNIVPHSDGMKVFTLENVQQYDSLTNVNERSFSFLPGQTLFMHGVGSERKGYYNAFFTTNFLIGEEKTLYKSLKGYYTPAKEVVGKYFEVLKVWIKKEELLEGCCLLLREKESGDEVYYNPYIYPYCMTCIGYYEKLKRHIGQTFLSLAKAVKTEDGQVIIPSEGTKYLCVDIGLKMNSDGAFLIMEGTDGIRVEASPIGGDGVYEFVSTEYIARLEKRYGKKYGEQIAFRKVDTGMTREMVITAWGEPYRKSEVRNGGRIVETWYFSDNRYVELLDGKVKNIRIY